MLRIDPLETALPRDLRESIRDHPWVAIAVGAAAGFYLGRNHGRFLLSALATAGIAVGAERLKALGGTSRETRKS